METAPAIDLFPRQQARFAIHRHPLNRILFGKAVGPPRKDPHWGRQNKRSSHLIPTMSITP
jgi:hypothetical protein